MRWSHVLNWTIVRLKNLTNHDKSNLWSENSISCNFKNDQSNCNSKSQPQFELKSHEWRNRRNERFQRKIVLKWEKENDQTESDWNKNEKTASSNSWTANISRERKIKQCWKFEIEEFSFREFEIFDEKWFNERNEQEIA